MHPKRHHIGEQSHELLSDQPLFQTVARVEQNAVRDIGLGADLNLHHIADGAAVSIGHNRAFGVIHHLKGDRGRLRQQGSPPAARPKGRHRGQRQDIRPNRQDRSMGGDILLDMLLHATDEERLLCSSRLAAMSEAPRRVLRYLAQCDLEIARPLLEASEAFDSSDLLEIVDHVSTDHRLLVAGRKKVPIAVCDALSRRAEVTVMQVLLGNRGAHFSETAMDVLVERSRKEAGLVSLLITRLELKPAQALAMFWWSDRETRRMILQRHAADRAEMVDMCADVFAIAAKEGWSDPVARKTLQLIERRQRNRGAIEKSPYDSLEGAVEAAARDKAQELLEDLNRQSSAQHREAEGSAGPRQRYRLGVYFYREDAAAADPDEKAEDT